MPDASLEEILRRIGQEETVPPPSLIRATKRRIRSSPLLPVAVFLSLGLQLLCGIGVVLVLISPDIAWSTKAYVLLGLSLLSALFLLPLVAVRDQIRVLFEEAELLAGHRS